jgi:hypothetical protein
MVQEAAADDVVATALRRTREDPPTLISPSQKRISTTCRAGRANGARRVRHECRRDDRLARLVGARAHRGASHTAQHSITQDQTALYWAHHSTRKRTSFKMGSRPPWCTPERTARRPAISWRAEHYYPQQRQEQQKQHPQQQQQRRQQRHHHQRITRSRRDRQHHRDHPPSCSYRLALTNAPLGLFHDGQHLRNTTARPSTTTRDCGGVIGAC